MPDKSVILEHFGREPQRGPFPSELSQILSAEMATEAAREIRDWPGYASTPLRTLDTLAAELGIGALYYKDEARRFGLGSFKALGGAYAVLRLAADLVEARSGARPSLRTIREGHFSRQLSELTVVTATDGNHGRSVAWGAQMAGCRCRIYIHSHVSPGRERAMADLGAEVIRIDGDYDASVATCAQEAQQYGWHVVSDTSYEGYMDLPRYVMAGYSVMAGEVVEQLAGQAPSHVFIQAGVGGLAAAVCAVLWQAYGDRRPVFVIVEPARAACLMATAKSGAPTAVPLEEETMMAGLSCGEVSLLAWDVLAVGAEHYVTIGEGQVAPVMRLLASGGAGGGEIVAGESAVPGLVALMGACCDPALRRDIGLTDDSRVLTFGCEGATDPEIYNAIIGGAD